MERPFKVFVSFTAEDLSSHAEAACRIARGCGWMPIDHRYWAPSGRPSVEECKDQIQDCDALVVLVAHRYGWIPNPEEGGDGEKSITWLEVDFARSQRLPVVPFLLRDGVPWSTSFVEGLGNLPVFEKLENFKADLRRFHSGFFSDKPESIEGPVAVALQRLERSLSQNSRQSVRHVLSSGESPRRVISRASLLEIQRRAFSTMLVEMLALAENDSLIVVHDESLDAFLPALTEALCVRNIRTTIIQLPKQYQLSMIKRSRDGIHLESDSLPGISHAFNSASAIFTCLDDDSTTAAIRSSLIRMPRRKSSRLLHVPGLNDAILRAVADQNGENMKRHADLLAARLSTAHKIEIFTYDKAQTLHRLLVDIDPISCRTLINASELQPGGWGNVPNGSVSVLSTRGTASGQIVIDGSAPGIVLEGQEHGVLEFSPGVLTAIDSRNRSFISLFQELRAIAASSGDSNWSNFANLQFGLNDGIRDLSGNSLIDPKAQGSLTVSIGDNTALGGRNNSSMHMDFVTRHATVFVDGVEVVRSGAVTLEAF